MGSWPSLSCVNDEKSLDWLMGFLKAAFVPVDLK